MRLGGSVRIILWNLTVVGFVSWGCGAANPSGPTPLNQVNGLSSVDGALAAPARGRIDGAATVSWSCFTGGAFGAPADCPAPRVGAQGVATGEIITAAPTNLERGVNGTTVSLRWGFPRAISQRLCHRSGDGARPQQHHYL